MRLPDAFNAGAKRRRCFQLVEGDLSGAGRRSVAPDANAFRVAPGPFRGDLQEAPILSSATTSIYLVPIKTAVISMVKVPANGKVSVHRRRRFASHDAGNPGAIRAHAAECWPNTEGAIPQTCRRCVARRNRHNGGFPSPILAALSLREGGAPRSKRPIE